MQCFVISPIGEEGSEVRKRADKVYKYIISPVCEECGFEAILGAYSMQGYSSGEQFNI